MQPYSAVESISGFCINKANEETLVNRSYLTAFMNEIKDFSCISDRNVCVTDRSVQGYKNL